MKYLLCGINAKYIHSNLAIFCLHAYAKKHCPKSAQVVIREYTINHYVEDILQDLYEAKANVLIFSCYIWNISYVRELAAELKKISPDTLLWVGGPEVSYDADGFLAKNPAVDLVMQGEGEEVFSKLVTVCEEESKRKNKAEGNGLKRLWESVLPTFREISGIAFRCPPAFSEREAICNTGFASIMDLNQVPFVYEDFRLFDHKILYYETSRGCPFSCSYCLSSVDKTVRFRNLDTVKKELQLFLDAHVPQVKFVDRTFNCNKKHAMAVWNYILEKDNGVTNFHFEISSDLLGEEEFALFEKMRPGLIQLEIGVQSTNPPTIEAIHRHMDLERLFENVDRVHGLFNIHQHLDLIAGLPYETYPQFRISFNDLYAHHPDQLQLGFLKVLKGTYMEQVAQKYGIQYRSLPPYEVLKTNWLSYEEVIALKGIEELVELYYNSGQYTYTLFYLLPFFESPFDFFERFSKAYRKRGYHKLNHSRMEKYEILRQFARECFSKDDRREEIFSYMDSILLLDLYLRENVKARPVWAGESTLSKKQVKEFCQSLGILKQSHIEKFNFDVRGLMETGSIVKKDCFCLFDYSRRNPLNREAQTKVFDIFPGNGMEK